MSTSMNAQSGSVQDFPQQSPQTAFREGWGWLVVLGTALIALGCAAICVPIAVTFAVELILGWVLVVGGIVQGIHAFRSRGTSAVFPTTLIAILYFIVGVLLLAYPLQGVLTLTLLLAIFFVLEGVFKMGMAWQTRSAGSWGWLFFSGVVAFVLGLFIWLAWPAVAAWLIGLLVGIDLLFGGCAMIMYAIAKRGPALPKETSIF